jgi:hypothetical protein
MSLFSQESITVGSTIPIIATQDASENPFPLPGGLKKIIFVGEMEASKMIHAVMEEKGQNHLDKNNTAILADIHKMPSLISKWVALPKMKGYSYKQHLIRDDKSGAPFPREPKKVTGIRIKDGKVQSIRFLVSESEISQFILEP